MDSLPSSSRFGPPSVSIAARRAADERHRNHKERLLTRLGVSWGYLPKAAEPPGCVEIAARVRSSRWPETTAALCVEKLCDTRLSCVLGMVSCSRAQVHLHFSRCQQGHVLGQNGRDCPVVTVLGAAVQPGGHVATRLCLLRTRQVVREARCRPVALCVRLHLVFMTFPEGSSGLAQRTGSTDQLRFRSPRCLQDFKMSFYSIPDENMQE